MYSDRRLYNEVRLESERTRVPVSLMGDLAAFTSDIRELHSKEGHDASRPAIATGIRLATFAKGRVTSANSITFFSILILQGFLTAGLTSDYSAGVEMYEKALGILKWGQEEWDGVPKDERGVVFEDTFVRGVRDLHLDAYMKAGF